MKCLPPAGLAMVALVACRAVACPPPPPSTPEQQAEVQWRNADNLCLAALDPGSLSATKVEGGGRWAIARAHWRVRVVPTATLKGTCAARTVVFPEVAPALCGLGLPALGAPLVVAVTDDGVMTWWIDAGAPLADTLRERARPEPR